MNHNFLTEASILIIPCLVAAARYSFESVPSNALRPAPWVQAFETKLNPNGPLLRLRLRFVRFFKSTLLPNFNTTVEREFPIVGGQQLEDTFSIVHTNMRSLLNMFGLGTNEVRVKLHKSGDDY